MSASAAESPSSTSSNPGELKIVPGPRVQQPAPIIPKPVTTEPARRPRRIGRLVPLLLLVVAVALVALAVTRATQAPPAVHYVTASVTEGAVTRTVTASGSVNPVTTIQVGSYVSGVIETLYCDYNTQVRKGQLCAKIDPRPYQTIVDQNRANLATAKSQLAKDQTNLDYAKLTHERTVDLRERGIVSEDTLDSAKSTWDQAAAQVDLDQSTVKQHQAALDAAELNVSYTNIVSPVNGTVVSRNVTMGQTVAASFQTPTLFLIATDLTKMQVDANVSESDIGGIVEGNAATFTVEAFPTRTFEGEVTQVRQAPQTVQNVITYDVVISVPNLDLALKPGMTATVRIVVVKRDKVIRVPEQALRYTPGGLTAGAASAHANTQVWVVRDGRPVAMPITIGLEDDTVAEVLHGDVHAGDEVVTSEQVSSGAASSRPPLFRF
jgi:HlyD family secretion protein